MADDEADGRRQIVNADIIKGRRGDAMKSFWAKNFHTIARGTSAKFPRKKLLLIQANVYI